MQIKEIKSELQKGDYQIIEKATGVSYSLISKVFTGSRGAESGKGRRVLAAAKKIVDNRKSLIEELS